MNLQWFAMFPFCFSDSTRRIKFDGGAYFGKCVVNDSLLFHYYSRKNQHFWRAVPVVDFKAHELLATKSNEGPCRTRKIPKKHHNLLKNKAHSTFDGQNVRSKRRCMLTGTKIKFLLFEFSRVFVCITFALVCITLVCIIWQVQKKNLISPIAVSQKKIEYNH